VLVAYAAVYVSWTALHWSGSRTLVSDVAPIPMAVAATVLAWLAGHDPRAPARQQRVWRFIAFGCASWTLGECLWLYFEVFRHRSPFPSPADGFYLGFYALVFAGVVQVPVRELARKERLTFALDLGTVMFVTVMVVWYLVIEPTARMDEDLLTRTLALAYPVADVVLVLGVSRMLLRRGTGTDARGAPALLAAGMVALACADIGYARLDLSGMYRPGTLPDALWMLALLGVALAGLVQASSPPESPVSEARDPIPPVSKLPYAAVLIGLVLVLNETSRDLGGPLAVLLLGALGLALIVVARQVSVLSDNERLLEEMHRLANTDPLTGVANRRRLFETAPRIVVQARMAGLSVTVAMVDIDQFKDINDRYGHAVGDEVIRAVASRCASVLRPSDLLARYGGDEFAAVVTGDSTTSCRDVAMQLRRRIADEPTETSGGAIDVTISVGVATMTEGDIERLLRDADAALLRAKRAGRDAVIRAPAGRVTAEPVAGAGP
jgi:diguanylate cyclase (GGDEF)-like protein